jgi:O-acetyl-ADP-ribose deacetylase (regulator of RNase III)
MTRTEEMNYLITSLLKEMPMYEEEAKKFTSDDKAQRRLLRSLMNVRPALPLDPEFLKVQDHFLQEENRAKGFVLVSDTEDTKYPTLHLYKGDITRLKVDAIVNAANGSLLGCFIPCHNCIDNAIHSAAGLELRDICKKVIDEQGHQEIPGDAHLTEGFNLPAKYVIHTVGPTVGGRLTDADCETLRAAYITDLKLAKLHKMKSLGLCCLSTGVFGFPKKEAAKIAVETVLSFIKENDLKTEIIFDVYSDDNYKIYSKLLK